MDRWNIKMVIFILVNGKIIKKMVMVNINIKMVIYIKVIIKMI